MKFLKSLLIIASGIAVLGCLNSSPNYINKSSLDGEPLIKIHTFLFQEKESDNCGYIYFTELASSVEEFSSDAIFTVNFTSSSSKNDRINLELYGMTDFSRAPFETLTFSKGGGGNRRETITCPTSNSVKLAYELDSEGLEPDCNLKLSDEQKQFNQSACMAKIALMPIQPASELEKYEPNIFKELVASTYIGNVKPF